MNKLILNLILYDLCSYNKMYWKADVITEVAKLVLMGFFSDYKEIYTRSYYLAVRFCNRLQYIYAHLAHTKTQKICISLAFPPSQYEQKQN